VHRFRATTCGVAFLDRFRTPRESKCNTCGQSKPLNAFPVPPDLLELLARAEKNVQSITKREGADSTAALIAGSMLRDQQTKAAAYRRLCEACRADNTRQCVWCHETKPVLEFPSLDATGTWRAYDGTVCPLWQLCDSCIHQCGMCAACGHFINALDFRRLPDGTHWEKLQTPYGFSAAVLMGRSRICTHCEQAGENLT
jgi:hypothetical protein